MENITGIDQRPGEVFFKDVLTTSGNASVGGDFDTSGDMSVAGAITVDDVSIGGLMVLSPHEVTASGSVSGQSFIQINNGAAAVAVTLGAVSAGMLLIVTQTDSGTHGHTVTAPSGVTLNGTNNTATLNAEGETLAVVFVTATDGIILQNVGAVALSTV